MELSKEDFLAYVPFSKNISLTEVAPYVQDALLMDVKPLLGDLGVRLLLNAAPELEPFTPAELKAREQIKAVWVLNAYERFLPFHGINISPAGMTKTISREGNYEHVSLQERSSMVSSVREKKVFWESELGKTLSELNASGRPAQRRSGIKMRVTGQRKRGTCDRGGYECRCIDCR